MSESEKANGQEAEKFRIVIEVDPATNQVNIFSNIPNEIFMTGLIETARRQMMGHHALLRMKTLRDQADKEIIAPPIGLKVQ